MLIQRITVQYPYGEVERACNLLKTERQRLEQEGNSHRIGNRQPLLMTPWQIADVSIGEYEFDSVDDMRDKWARWETSVGGKSFLQAYAPLIKPGMATELFDMAPGQPPSNQIQPGWLIQRLTVRYRVGKLPEALKLLVAESKRCREAGITFFGDARFITPWSTTDTSIGIFPFAHAGEMQEAWTNWEVSAGGKAFLEDYGPLSAGGMTAEINNIL